MILLKEAEYREDTKLFPSIAKVIDRLKWDPVLKKKYGDYNIGLRSR